MTDTTLIASQTINDFASVNDNSMFEWTISIINILLLIITAYYIRKSPIDAVKIAEEMQLSRAEADRKYQNKFNIFATILGLRHALGGNENFVICINQISIVFNDNENILSKLKKFIDKHKNSKENTELQPLLNDLIIAMAADLGYSHIDNALITDCFSPDVSYNRYIVNSYQDIDYLAHRNNVNNKDIAS